MWFENKNGTIKKHPIDYVKEVTAWPSDPSSCITAGDIDGVGDVDIVLAWGALIWYDNDGNATQFNKHSISSQFNAYTVHLDDCDGDMDIDILTSSLFEVVMHQALGNASFTEHLILITR